MDDSDARKATPSATAEKAIPPRTKRLTLDVPQALHRAIKISAAQDGVTMSEKLRALLLKHYGLDS